MKTLADFTQLVQLCLASAAEKYGEIPHVDIRYDIRGKCAGMAGAASVNRYTGEVKGLYLRFNREAITKNWDEMVNQTIPHEVAHIVAYVHRRLGAKNHNWAWQQIDRALGGTGERCHKMELTPGRRTTRHLYRLENGLEFKIGPKHHSGLQAGKYGYLKDKKGNYIRANNYVGVAPA